MPWDRQRSLDRIARRWEARDAEVTVSKLVRHMDLENITLRNSRRIYGAHLYATVAGPSLLQRLDTIGATALLTVGSAATWYPDHLKREPAPVFAWFAVGLAVAGIFFVGLAVKPRLNPSPRRGQPPHYFGDVDEYYPKWWQRKSRDELKSRGRGEYDKAIASASDDEYEKRIEDQLWVLSHIAARKYRLVSTGMRLFALAGIVSLIAFLVENRGI